jgi:hypothetical protein
LAASTSWKSQFPFLAILSLSLFFLILGPNPMPTNSGVHHGTYQNSMETLHKPFVSPQIS